MIGPTSARISALNVAALLEFFRGLYAIDATPIVASTPSTRCLSDGVTVWVS